MTLRDESRASFISILEDEPLFQCLSQVSRLALATRLESSCHNANIDYCKTNHIPIFWDDETFVEHYSMNIYRVSINLDPTSSVNTAQPKPYNRVLMDRVLLTALFSELPIATRFRNPAKLIDRLGIDIKQIGYMSSQELNSHSSQQYLEALAIRATQKVDVKTTKMYTCAQCNKRDATFYRLQTRSGDEGYTTFFQCQFCEHRWTLR